jgi:PAS domain S-box-containing protein
VKVTRRNKAQKFSHDDAVSIAPRKAKSKRVRHAPPNVTERKLIEKRLRESEARFRAIAESSLDVISTVDLEGRVTFVSPSVERVLGYRPEELVGRPFQEFIHEAGRPLVIQAFSKIMRGENVEGSQLLLLRKDGSPVYFEMNGAPTLRDGKIVAVQGVLRDITERKRAEEALRLSEAKYRAVVDNATDFIFLVGEKDEVMSMNPVGARVLGKTVEQVLGKSLFDVFPKEVATTFSENVRAVLQTRKNWSSDEKIVLAGNDFWMNTRLEPLLDDRGRAYAASRRQTSRSPNDQ